MQIKYILSPIDMQKILIHLRKKGFTEVEIARLVGTNQSTISRILSGKVRKPRGNVIPRLKQIYFQENI